MALRGLRMYLIGGQTREANRSTYEVAVSLGALVDGVDVDDADVLVGDSVNTPEYLGVVQRQGFNKPIVSPSWLAACRQAQQQLPFEQHILGPFAGLNVCITGFTDQHSRTWLPDQVQKGGGSYSADMYRSCTHLIAKTATGSKYKHAVSWGTVHIVSLDWVKACIECGVRQDEKLYPPPLVAPAADALQRQAQPFPAPSASSAVEAVKAVRFSSLDPGGKAKPGSTTERPTALAPSTTAGRAHLPTATTTSATTVAQLPPLPAAQPRPAAPPPAHGPGASRQPQLQEAPSRPVHDEAGTSCLFMDWVRFHAVGMSAQEALELRRLVCEGGAVREPALVGRVTHILVGSEPTAAELQAVRDHMAEWRDAVKVSLCFSGSQDSLPIKVSRCSSAWHS
ncbi:hypothetical protein V8C86DRAFT_2453652 [Haematococcus lacustris]